MCHIHTLTYFPWIFPNKSVFLFLYMQPYRKKIMHSNENISKCLFKCTPIASLFIFNPTRRHFYDQNPLLIWCIAFFVYDLFACSIVVKFIWIKIILYLMKVLIAVRFTSRKWKEKNEKKIWYIERKFDFTNRSFSCCWGRFNSFRQKLIKFVFTLKFSILKRWLNGVSNYIIQKLYFFQKASEIFSSLMFLNSYLDVSFCRTLLL